MAYDINHIFEDDYPEEAALWCNENGAYIEELDPVDGEVERQELVVEAELDAEGNEIKPAEYKTVTEKVKIRRFQIVAIPEPTEAELAAQALTRAKAERAAAVAALAVEVDGMTFDGDEKAQERMARAVLMAESPEESMEWVLADSSVAVVTAEQLRRACRAAGKAQGALWVKPYEA